MLEEVNAFLQTDNLPTLNPEEIRNLSSGNINHVNQYIRENSMRSLKKLKIALPHDPTKSLLDIYTRK